MAALLFLIIVIPLGLFLSGFWSASETALTSLSGARIKKIVAHRKKIARGLNRWVSNPEYFLITILVGNTLTNLTLSHITTVVVLSVLPVFYHSLASMVLWLGLTALVLIFGEIAPKLLARRYPERITIAVLPFYHFVMRILRPVFSGIEKITKSEQTFILPSHKLNIDEIKQLLTESRQGGMVRQETEQMVLQALRLNRVAVQDIMTVAQQIEAVDLNQPEAVLLDRLVETGKSRIPVYRGNRYHIVGYIHMRDLLWLWQQRQGKFTPEIIKLPYFIPPEMKLLPLLTEFQSGNTHIAFVVNEFGELLGLVTLEDILEEMLGEILDEYDIKKSQGGQCSLER